MKEHWFPIVLFVGVLVVAGIQMGEHWHDGAGEGGSAMDAAKAVATVDTVWYGRKAEEIPADEEMVRYGHELIARTSYYLGPKGIVSHITNGMNCQNCHLDGGTIPFGNNYGKVFSTYPQFRARSASIQTIAGRVNDCMERSLNGLALDSNSREMKAIYAYMKWLGEGIPKGVARGGTGIMKLAMPDRICDTLHGGVVYASNCASCHGPKGEGVLNAFATEYTYPPLWGPHSYNDGAGLFRVSNFAGFVRNNMPFGTNWHSPRLTDEEAWDVAAYVNSQPRPHKDQHADWKDMRTKPVDFPMGPYADSFSAVQHKYGPWKPILAVIKKK